jgi:hypothetical protein
VSWRESTFRPCPLLYTSYTVSFMSQLNIRTDQTLERNLSRLMKVRRIATKSEAIRFAVLDSLERALEQSENATDFHSWVGWARRAPLNQNPRFQNDDELWDSKS